MKTSNRHFLSLLFLLLSAFAAPGSGGPMRGVFQGTVVDENSDPLPFTNILIRELNTGCVTDNSGRFALRLPPGRYNVRISYIGYKSTVDSLNILPDRTIERKYVLTSTALQIGGIQVIADEELLPISPETQSRIHSGEIEHMQASSLNDVMELTPGVETSNPTLNTPEQLSIRGGDGVGAQLVLNGVPITNNANMQIGIGYSTANGGLDLRSIPAENVQEVRIIRGIPSAQYGDLTDGVMVVTTKESAEALRIKFKYNPHLYETNISAGKAIGPWIVNGNLNVAMSEHDVRVEGDGYTRIAGEVGLSRSNERFDLKNRVTVTRTLDESKEKPGYALREAWYNRDINVKWTTNYRRHFSPQRRLSATASANWTRQNSFKQQLVSRDNLVMSDRTTEGTQEGRIVFGSYLGEKWIKGNIWNLYNDLQYQHRIESGRFIHTWSGGLTARMDLNNGEGIVVDPLYPPSLSVTSPRLRRYDELPVYPIVNLYLEDKITGRLWKPFTLQIGARYEAYRPHGMNIAGLWSSKPFIESHNGSFLNPRINFSMSLLPTTQIRVGFGQTSKSPPMGMIFAEDNYYDIVDTVSVVDPLQPEKNFSLITTTILPQANPTLQGYKQKKYEISLDQQIGNFGLSLTAFGNESSDMFDSKGIPFLLFKREFPNYPDLSTAVIKDTLMESNTRYLNNRWHHIRGVEFSLTTRRLPVIDTVIKLDAAYHDQESGTQDDLYFGSRRYSPELGLDVRPLYHSNGKKYKDLLINYRFDIQAKPLGIWLTLHVQQKVIEINGPLGQADSLAVGYFDGAGNTILIPPDSKTDPIYIRLWDPIQDYEWIDEDRPNKWLVNLKVSKALWRGAEVSFYVNNLFNHRPLYRRKSMPSTSVYYERRNSPIFYGVEFSTLLDEVF